MNDMLDWVEKAAMENLQSRLKATDTLAEESSKTLTILIAAIGGSFAYAVGGKTHLLAAFGLTAYLCVISLLLVWHCLRIKESQAPTNTPNNLFQENRCLQEIRRAELKNIQERIDKTVARNDQTAKWLNRIRLAAILGPALFVAIVIFSAGPVNLYG